MSLSDCLEGVDSAGILFPIRGVTSVSAQTVKYQKSSLHDLHDLAETTLSNNLEQFKVLQFQAPLLVLHKGDPDLDRPGTKLQIQPLSPSLTRNPVLVGMSRGSFLVVFLAELGIVHIRLRLFETRMDFDRTEEDVLTPTGTRPGSGISKVKLYRQLRLPGHIKLESGVVTSPEGVLRGPRYGIDEDLVLFEI